MLLPAKNRRKLERLVILSEKTHRQIGAEAGWKSHTMLSQLIHGHRNTIGAESAIRLCVSLRCDVSDLFLPRVSSLSRQKSVTVGTQERVA